MKVRPPYSDKFEKIETQTLFNNLDGCEREAVRAIAFENRFTLGELASFVESSIDLGTWNEKSLCKRWMQWRQESNLRGREFKKWAFARRDELLKKLAEEETRYGTEGNNGLPNRATKLKIRTDVQNGSIFGMCPVRSEKTLCCNLRTIDAVKNCGFGCSYCSIQTMYTGDNILFDENFGDKLEAIELDPKKGYHIGTGQSSDALMWGNKNGILDDMFRFATKWPNILLELKTKSRNIDYFLRSDVPANVICSWSLNPEVVVKNEEHLTASLSQRLDAARWVSDEGIGVAFHLHPMVHYEGWQGGYSSLIERLTDNFNHDEVTFVSFGALTFPKPIIRKIRTSGIKTRIHQMPMSPNPEGKMTYPDHIKEALFGHAYRAFSVWHGNVFFYLCMEESKFWESTFGELYTDNEAFERDLLESTRAKLAISPVWASNS
jgi:spore photoproduct lyase